MTETFTDALLGDPIAIALLIILGVALTACAVVAIWILRK